MSLSVEQFIAYPSLGFPAMSSFDQAQLLEVLLSECRLLAESSPQLSESQRQLGFEVESVVRRGDTEALASVRRRIDDSVDQVLRERSDVNLDEIIVLQSFAQLLPLADRKATEDQKTWTAALLGIVDAWERGGFSEDSVQAALARYVSSLNNSMVKL